jgi:hypothetical protein
MDLALPAFLDFVARQAAERDLAVTADEPFPSAFKVTDGPGAAPVVRARLNRERPTR